MFKEGFFLNLHLLTSLLSVCCRHAIRGIFAEGGVKGEVKGQLCGITSFLPPYVPWDCPGGNKLLYWIKCILRILALYMYPFLFLPVPFFCFFVGWLVLFAITTHGSSCRMALMLWELCLFASTAWLLGPPLQLNCSHHSY